MIKKLAAAIVLVMVASLSVAGCTSLLNTTTTGSASPTPSPSPPPDNLASAIDNFYKQGNYTVNVPCSMTKKNDTVTYQVFVTDPLTVYPRHSTNVTIVLTTNKTAASDAYDIAQANFYAFQQSHPLSYSTQVKPTSPGKTSSLVLYGATTTGVDYLNKVDMTEYYQLLSAFGTQIT